MKRCPNCNRTYADDTMTNCAHDGAPLAPAAYIPHGAPPIPPPQAYAPPPPGYPPQPQAYQQGYPQQNYPPPGNYPPPHYPPQPGWQPRPGASGFAPCPACMQPDPEPVKFTWWGGLLGPRLFTHVKCRWCATTYNGKTGQSNTMNIVMYSVFFFAIALGIILVITIGTR